MTKLAELEIPALEGGWINLTEAAERLGFTRSYMYKKAARYGQPGGFETIRKIGTQASYVIAESEVEDLLTRAREESEQPVVEAVEEKPKRKPRAKKEKPVESIVVPQDPAIGEIEPEPSPITTAEPTPVIEEEPEAPAPFDIVEVEFDEEAPLAGETPNSHSSQEPKELSIDEILAQI
jgi:hypothetical protein